MQNECTILEDWHLYVQMISSLLLKGEQLFTKSLLWFDSVGQPLKVDTHSICCTRLQVLGVLL